MIFNFDEIEYVENYEKQKICIGNMVQFQFLVTIVFKNILDMYDDCECNKPTLRCLFLDCNDDNNYMLYKKVKKHIEYICTIIYYRIRVEKKYYANLINLNSVEFTDEVFRSQHLSWREHHLKAVNDFVEYLAHRQIDSDENLCYI